MFRRYLCRLCSCGQSSEWFYLFQAQFHNPCILYRRYSLLRCRWYPSDFQFRGFVVFCINDGISKFDFILALSVDEIFTAIFASPVLLVTVRLELRQDYDNRAVSTIQQAFGSNYDWLALYDSRQYISNLLKEYYQSALCAEPPVSGRKRTQPARPHAGVAEAEETEAQGL